MTVVVAMIVVAMIVVAMIGAGVMVAVVTSIVAEQAETVVVEMAARGWRGLWK